MYYILYVIYFVLLLPDREFSMIPIFCIRPSSPVDTVADAGAIVHFKMDAHKQQKKAGTQEDHGEITGSSSGGSRN